MEWIEVMIGFLIIFGCGLGIFMFGVWAGKQTTHPLGFWANGKSMESKSVSDISGYNADYGKLFRQYAMWFLLAGIAMLFSVFLDLFAYISLGILFLSCTFGLWRLIHSYKAIEKKYILQ